jgi:hypothetical protein
LQIVPCEFNINFCRTSKKKIYWPFPSWDTAKKKRRRRHKEAKGVAEGHKEANGVAEGHKEVKGVAEGQNEDKVVAEGYTNTYDAEAVADRMLGGHCRHY